MNWKYLFIGSLCFSTFLTTVYFSLEWTTVESLGGWNIPIMLVIIGAPSFTFFSWMFKVSSKDPHFEEYNLGYLKSIYNSLLDKLSEDPSDRETLTSVHEAGKKYYHSIDAVNLDNKTQADIDEKTHLDKQVA